MSPTFRKASPTDAAAIWKILQQAIRRRRADGSEQWQDGYPNPEVVQQDLTRQCGWVLCAADDVMAYCALLVNDEPAYEHLQGGEWCIPVGVEDFLVVHRVAVADAHLHKGLAKELLRHAEAFARKNNIRSIKSDTYRDNAAMLHIFSQLDYTYCGRVYFRGNPREAFEKVLV